jgi:dihydrofolate synthase / folylpolyglutamate synthase
LEFLSRFLKNSPGDSNLKKSKLTTGHRKNNFSIPDENMTYRETLDFLYSQLPVYHRIGKAAYKANLDNTLALDSHFGSPHRQFKSVHVAGTNGKGSVSHMLASVFQAAGYRTGLYTSPHLRDYRERIRVNGVMISEDAVTRFVEENVDLIRELSPSFFELSVALAFKYFADQKADIAVIETGLGGRLDSTNIITPVLSVITNIGYDHMDLLGDTLEKIAFEKAGIIKRGIPVIIGETSAETENVFIKKAGESESNILFADSLFNCILDDNSSAGKGRAYSLTEINTGLEINGIAGLTGDYQARNIPTVFAAAGLLDKQFGLDKQTVQRGIEDVVKSTGLMGRWQIISEQPLVICDTGHNVDGLAFVVRQLGKLRKERIHYVIGFVNDKDLNLVLPLFPRDGCYYFTKASVPRAMDHQELRKRASDFGLKGTSHGSVAEALASAKANASAADVIFVGGSTFVVAEIV